MNDGLQPGDVVLTGVKSQGIVSLAIKLGQWLRRYPGWARRFSHAALVLNSDGELAEAQAAGVRRTHIARFELADYVVVRTAVDEHDQAQLLAFAESVLAARTRYGFLTFAGLALWCVTAPLPFIPTVYVQQAGTAICSGFVCDALTRAGFVWVRPPFAMTPADIAVHFEVQ